MTYLIVSDIHANLEALDAVVADARGRYDRIACLGDLVGYGADPNAVVEWSQANVAAVIRGNHDKACVGLDNLENYNPAARASAIWTRSALTPESRQYLEKLPRGPLVCEGADLAHGSPADEDEYLATPHDAELLRPFLGNALSFFGHTRAVGTSLPTTRFDLMMQSLGGRGVLVTEPDGIAPALERALASDEVWCINVPLDPAAYRRTGQVSMAI